MARRLSVAGRRIVMTLAVITLGSCQNVSDDDLRAAVIVRLAMDPSTSHLQLETHVRNREVRLIGDTATRQEQRQAVDVASSVAGVARVVSAMRLSDGAIREAVIHALAAEPMLNGVLIEVSVDRGVVRLESKATDRILRARAIGTTAQVDGVIRVEDYMR